MSLNLENKKAVVAGVAQTLKDAQTIVIAQYQGVTVSDMTVVRAAARKAGVYLHVLKNTLARKAVVGTKFEPLAKQMSGALVYSVSTDPVAAAKVLVDFAKTNEKLNVIAGMFNDKELDASAVKTLAATPSRDELISTLMGVMLQVPAGFVRTLAAIRDQKEQAA